MRIVKILSNSVILKRFFCYSTAYIYNAKQKTRHAELEDLGPPVKQRSKLYYWGSTGAEHVSTPHLLEHLGEHSIKTVAVGHGFTALVTEDHVANSNKLYGFGLNTDSQLSGYNQKTMSKLVERPHLINIPLIDPKTEILQLAAGRAHLLVLTQEGLFAFGNNAYGQCGYSPDGREDARKINFIRCVNGEEITKITCGLDHSLVITESGAVFATGWGADGQTGLQHFNNTWKFTKVEGDIKDERIVKLSCAGDFVLALNDKGEVFGWGNSEYGQVIIPEHLQCNRPTFLKDCSTVGRIVDIAAGGCFCAILDQNGVVYVWGYGLLGSYPNELKPVKANGPVKISPYLFGYSDFNPTIKVESIYSGLFHLAALTTLGDVFTWGRNNWGCLGIETNKDQPFPLKVSIGDCVKYVCCGAHQTVALCQGK